MSETKLSSEENLRATIKRLRSRVTSTHPKEDSEYMVDPNNWVCVHTTRFVPQKTSSGKRHIKTTASATDYEYPRASIHFTLNQVVSDNNGGSWSDASIAILIPYNDVVSQCGNPKMISTEDTFFTPDPDSGIIIPDSAYIVKAAPNCDDLIKIDGHVITYKSDHFTDEDIKNILYIDASEGASYNYEELNNIKGFGIDIKRILGNDERIKRAYELSKNKEDFLRGMLEEDRSRILNEWLRNFAVATALEKMGKRFVKSHECEVCETVSNVAIQAGLDGSPHGKNHSCSVEFNLELSSCPFIFLSKALKDQNIDEVCKILKTLKEKKKCGHLEMGDKIIKSILENKPIPNIYDVYTTTFNQKKEEIKNDYNEYSHNICIPAKADEFKRKLDLMGTGGIEEYDPNLATSYHRHADKMTEEINQSLENLKGNPELYAQLQQKIRPPEYSLVHFASKNNEGK